MPKFLSTGIATSWRHVVGLQDPPKKTSYFGMPSETDGQSIFSQDRIFDVTN